MRNLTVLEAQKVVTSSASLDMTIELVTGLEPLYIPLFIKAQIADRVGGRIPTVNTYGFDQLARGMESTSGQTGFNPAVLIVDWTDFHPAASWRTRGSYQDVKTDEIGIRARTYFNKIGDWICARSGPTIVVLPSATWLPPLDAGPAFTVGEIRSELLLVRAKLASLAVQNGAQVLEADESLDSRHLYSAGLPIGPESANELASRIARLIVRDPRRKAIIVDLDETLWSGVLGEDGIEGIRSDDSPVGSPYRAFQRMLKKWSTEGIYLCFASKNSPNDVDAAFALPEVYLSRADFHYGVAGWQPKSQMIDQITAHLGIGVESVIFIDDNPSELAQVMDAEPMICALRTPVNAREWVPFFEEVQNLVWTPSVSEEDRIRSTDTELVRHQRGIATAAKSDGISHLAGLELQLAIDVDAAADPRSMELVNKTNQFNVNGFRTRESDWIRSFSQPPGFCMVGRLSDKFGDFGKIAVLAGTRLPGRFVLSHLVVSCRALGRGVEVAMLAELVNRYAVDNLVVLWRETPRNEPAIRFVQSVSHGLAGTEGANQSDMGGECFEAAIDIAKVRRLYSELCTEGGLVVD